MKHKVNWNPSESRKERQWGGEPGQKKIGKLEDQSSRYYIQWIGIPKRKKTQGLQSMSFQSERAQHVANKMNDTKHIGIPRNIIKVHNSRNKTILKASRDQGVGGEGRS